MWLLRKRQRSLSIPRPRSDLPKRAHAIEHHIEQVLGMIHARSIALSDLSEVGKPQGRQLNPTEQMIAAVGEDAHQIALAVEALLEALRYQRNRHRRRVGAILVLMIPVLLIGMLLGASYGIEEGRSRERYDAQFKTLPMLPEEGRLR